MSSESLQWFRSYLSGRQQCVRVNGVRSTMQANNMGVPQGSVLAPLLFTMYINDLPKCCPGINCQMYADDTVVHVSAKTSSLAGEHLTKALINISKWLESSHLSLNVKKTVSMCFSIRNRPLSDIFEVQIKKEVIEVVNEVKYLGIILDNNLKFDNHVKYICKKVKPNINCFRFIRRDLSCHTAKLYMHAMIFSHLSYCITSWSQASPSKLKPIFSIYKQTIKIMDRKPMKWHHCDVLTKHQLMGFDSFIDFNYIKLVYKCLNNHVSPMFSELVSRRQSSQRANTRATVRGDCLVPKCKTSFGQSAFSVKGPKLWNALPTNLKLETDGNAFNRGLKQWLKTKQQCSHV